MAERQVILRDVPPDEADNVVMSFESEGATVTKEIQPDGNYMITATFPDS